MRFRALAAALIVLAATLVATGQQRTAPHFRPDDPLLVDNDRVVDVGELEELEESDIYDFLVSTFGSPGDESDIPAVNVNTLGDVPDSSWFTNRYRDGLPLPDILARGPDTLPSLDITGWPVSEGKDSGASPGLRVRGPDGRDYQIKFDPPAHPEMSTGAEVIGAAFYHAFGYHTVEMYLVEFDGARFTLTDDAETGDGDRPLTRRDIEAVLRVSARLPNGRYRGVARRYPPDSDVVGSFRYYGTRPDDPNDIFPHEHRRELRGNRVFAAWLNHDDSRGANSKDIVVQEDGRRYVKHFMYDFNSILGSGNQKAQKYRSGNEYRVDGREALKTALTLGLYVRPWARIDYPDVPLAVGRFESDFFDPAAWKPEYPIPAFERMQPDDAFWAARIVARFDEPAVRALVEKGRYSDPAATAFIVRTLMERREKVLRTWLNVVTPVVDPVLDDRGLTFANAAVDARVATPPAAYRVTWFAFDNASGTHRQQGAAMTIAPGETVPLPAALADEAFVMAEIAADGVATPPVQMYFRRQASGWQTVGVGRGFSLGT